MDEFFSQLESQKIDVKVAQQEKQAMKKLENIKKDHESRLQLLEQEQAQDRRCGELIGKRLNFILPANIGLREQVFLSPLHSGRFVR